MEAQEGQLICGKGFYACQCDEPPTHEGPHVCRCGGSWEDDGKIVALPQESLGLAELLTQRGKYRMEK